MHLINFVNKYKCYFLSLQLRSLTNQKGSQQLPS
jgi:hypothetical protein